MESSEETPVKSAEFQAIILAGGEGNRLYPIADNIPKPLIPVANLPLICYQLKLLERAGFTETIVVTLEKYASAINDYLQDNYGHDGAVSVKYEIVPENSGTADAIRQLHAKDKIKTDFLVISGDVITEVFLEDLADVHRVRGATVTMLLKEEEREEEGTKRRARPRREDEDIDYIGIAEGEDRVLFFVPSVCVDQQLSVPRQLLMRKPNLTVHTNLLDCHLYFFSHCVLDVLKEQQALSCIKTDLVPYLIRRQFSGGGGVPSGVGAGASEDTALALSSSQSFSHDDALRVFCVTLPAQGAYALRANSLQSFAVANRELASFPVSGRTPWASPQAAMSETELSRFKDCAVGTGCTMEDNVSLKLSVIGQKCVLGPRAKLNNCVVMDNVRIGENCIIQNSIICTGAVIAPGTNINECQVGAHVTVDAGTYKGEMMLPGQ